MDSFFTGKRTIVTGAGKGIGRAIAVRLCELGAKVIAISRTQTDLDSLKSEYQTIHTILLDIGDWDKTRAAVEGIGPVDMLVNNAGVIGEPVSFLETTRENLQNVHDVNFAAAFNISQVVVRGMINRNTGGAVVNVSSIAGKTPRVNASYDTSKAALDMLTMTMAKELGPYQIRTNSVSPGYVITNILKEHVTVQEMLDLELPKIPLGRVTDTKDVVDLVVYLLSDRASMINGQRISVDGGAYLP